MNVISQTIHPRFNPSFSRFFYQSFALCLLSLAPCILSAATVDDLNFTSINNDTEYSVSAKDPASIAGALTIPATHNGKPVTAAGSFTYCSALTSVDLSQTAITSLEKYTFEKCSSLISVTLPQTLTAIGSSAFSNCDSLTSIDLSQTALKSIESSTFFNCASLASVTLPQTLTSIDSSAFSQCSSLASIDLSQTALTSIGQNTFSQCTALASVTLPQTLNSIGSDAFDLCSSLASIDLSQTALKSIKDSTFYRCTALASVTLPQTLTAIGSSAFSQCSSLASVTFPQTLNSIESYAFYNCIALISINLSQTALTSIKSYAFPNCLSLTSVTLPQTLNSLGDSAFQNCIQLASVTFLDSAPTLGADVFKDAGKDVSGGLKLTIYKDYEASYASWGTGYTFNVVPGPSTSGPIMLVLKTSYNPTSKALSILNKNEPSSATLILQHTDSLGGAWADLGNLDYIQVTDSTSGAVTRTLTLDPATKKTGFYRLSSSANP